jgi:hypothetical protein
MKKPKGAMPMRWESLISSMKVNEGAGWRGGHEWRSAQLERLLQANKQYRHDILTELEEALERWFRNGVTYSKHPLSLFIGKPVYDNMPLELDRVLEVAQGKIALDILEWLRIPLRLRPEVLMFSSALPLPSQREIKATFSIREKGPAVWPVYDTEKMQPKERAEIIANNWYELTTSRLLEYIEHHYRKIIDDAGPRPTVAIERELDKERRLRDMGFGIVEAIEFYACEQYEYAEVSGLLRNLGCVKSPDAIRKNHDRIKAKLANIEENP